MKSGAAGKSSSGIITSETELGGRFFLSLSLVHHSQNKRIFFFFLPIFTSEEELQDSSFSATVFLFFFLHSDIFATDLVFPFPPPQSLGEKI